MVRFESNGATAVTTGFGLGAPSNRFTAVKPLPDGGLAAVGYSSFFSGFVEARVVRIDTAGNQVWATPLLGYTQLEAGPGGAIAVVGTSGGEAILQRLAGDGASCWAPTHGATSSVPDAQAPIDTTAIPVDTVTTAVTVSAAETTTPLATALVCGTAPPPAGSKTCGLYDPVNSHFHLRNTNTSGTADLIFAYGPGGAGWQPLSGDWDGDGVDTLGLYDRTGSSFYLTDDPAPTYAQVVVSFGPGGLGWIPIVGDWDGDGDDSVGLYDGTTSTFYLRDTNTSGYADRTFVFGAAGSLPVAGRWAFNTAPARVGVYQPPQGGAPGSFHLDYGGPNGTTVPYGSLAEGSTPVTGDWDGTSDDTVGVFDALSALWRLRNSNTPGSASLMFHYGPGGAGWIPIAGDWDGQ